MTEKILITVDSDITSVVEELNRYIIENDIEPENIPVLFVVEPPLCAIFDSLEQMVGSIIEMMKKENEIKQVKYNTTIVKNPFSDGLFAIFSIPVIKTTVAPDPVFVSNQVGKC